MKKGFNFLRARAKINSHFGGSAGEADAKRRDAAMSCTSSRSGNAADASPAPRPVGLPPTSTLASLLAPYIPQRVCASLAPRHHACGQAAKCEVIFVRTLKLHPRATILVVLLLLAASVTIAQMADQHSRTPAGFFAEGALVYVEARDLESLLKWWKASEVKSDWENSQNHAQFRNSRLYLKLKDRLTKWGAGGNFSFTLDNLIQAAGTRSGLALYDIGELKMIAATRLPFTKAKTTELWLAKSRFQEKTSGNQTYYVEARQGTLAFAYVDPYLIISTEESLLTGAMENFRTPVQTLEQSQKWKLCQKQEKRDVSLFLDQEALQQNRYFQKYWIHRNVRDFASIQATWIDLVFEPHAIVEHRYFLQSSAGGPPAELSGHDSVKHFQQSRHEALYIDAPVTPAAAANHILKMVNRLPEKDTEIFYPPTFSGAAERASQAETRNLLLEQINEPVLQVKAETLLRASQEEQVVKLLEAAEPAAQIRMSYPLWDHQALFVRFPETLLLQLKNFTRFNQQAFLDQILEHFLLLHATQDEGGRWHSEGNGSFVLQSFRPLYVKFQEPWIVISTEEADFRQITGNLPASVPAGNYREVNWKDGRWKYTRLMQRLDHGAYQDNVPLLFSENIASLLAVLDPIVASSVTQKPNQEVVRYELD